MVSSSGTGGSGGIRNLNLAERDVTKSLNRLSTGLRINSAADDAAGLAIASQLNNLSRLADVGNLNISYGVSALQITDSALGQISEVTGRLSELAAQSANGTLSDEQRSALSEEFNGLREELNRIAATTEFNGVNLFNGESTNIQVNESSTISVGGTNLSQLLGSLNSLDIGTQESARQTLEAASTLSSQVNESRSGIGAGLARLQTAAENNTSTALSLRGAESRIRDLDFAKEQANLVTAQIRQEASTAVLAQGKLSARAVLQLLA